MKMSESSKTSPKKHPAADNGDDADMKEDGDEDMTDEFDVNAAMNQYTAQIEALKVIYTHLLSPCPCTCLMGVLPCTCEMNVRDHHPLGL